jgi:pyruvate,water dikinase
VEPSWNNLLTCDYERTRPDAPKLELDLYTRSLTGWPKVMLADPRPYGRLRSPGIVDIPRATHDALTSSWHRRLADPDYALDLARRAASDRDTAARQIDLLQAALHSQGPACGGDLVTAATAAMLPVMSAHIVNWLLPEDDWEQLLARLLGDHDSARKCMAALQLPEEPGHILAAHPGDGTGSGHLTGPRDIAVEQREKWLAAASRAAASDPGSAGRVEAASAVLQWAATSEERRKELRVRYLGIMREWAAVAGRPFTALTVTGLLHDETAPLGSLPLSRATGTQCGDKAAPLARAAAGGLPVPPGIVIPADTADGNLPALAEAICGELVPLTGCVLAVRSSVLHEDGPSASFAGARASRFTRADPGALLRAVREVRASGQSRGADASGAAHGLPGGAGVAVLIQEAVRPCVAGVLAGRLHAGHLEDWSIQAVYGLAGSLTAGRESGELHQPGQPPTPLCQETAILPAGHGEHNVPPGEKIWLPLPDGTAIPAKVRSCDGPLLTVDLPVQKLQAPLLPTRLRDKLLAFGAHAAGELGLPAIDVEWAITPDGEEHLLQARPLTTPVPALRAAPAGGGPQCWRGIPGSPGLATGHALHLRDAAGANATGAVLICAAIGADAIQALMDEPAAILATDGGQLSHAAIVARELGIPCVTALPTFIHAVPAGTILHVDGLAGTVTRAGGQATS